jgi:hypothetical protein
MHPELASNQAYQHDQGQFGPEGRGFMMGWICRLERLGFVDEHDRDPVLDRIHETIYVADE